MADFVMPSLGADMDAGTLVARKIEVGGHVKRGDVLAEVETDKGVIAVESFHEGIVSAWLVELGTRVPVGTRLAVIDVGDGARSEAETAAATAAAAGGATEAPTGAGAPTETGVRAESEALPRRTDDLRMTISARALALAHDVDPHTLHGTGRHGVITRSDVLHADEGPSRRPVSPLARRRAASLGVDVDDVAPNGSDGVVHAADVERFAAARPAVTAPSAESAPAQTADQRMRRAIAAAMTRSAREIPHYFVSHTIDLGPALDRLQAHNASVGVQARVLPAALLLKSVAVAVRAFPELNGHFVEDAARPSTDVHLGVAIALRKGGLVAPALAHADRRSLGSLMHGLEDLVQRARSGGLTATELGSATITVTSLGDRGVEAVFPIIHAPQLAMVGFGKVVTRPWVVDGSVVPRPVVTATLAADHRASDGHRGGLFLAALEAALTSPDALFIEPGGTPT